MTDPKKPTGETADDVTADLVPEGATQDPKPGATPHAPSGVNVPGYRIQGMLGRGGMGVVYKALQEKANRLVALKMILSGAHADQAERTRFNAEAEAAARLSHPNIVQLYEVGETPEGFPYFSLEFVNGRTLADRLKQNPLRPDEAAALVEALARAMQYAHERGIVHRDLKPANVLLQVADPRPAREDQGKSTLKPFGETQIALQTGVSTALVAIPKISDFGLAKQLDADDGMTRTGAIMGTPAYMAPEQAFGQSKMVGPAADIYALGAILYECLTGRPPFKGATIADTLEQVRTMEAVSPHVFVREIPRDLETICLHCLHKDPQRRYASAEALAEDLLHFQEQKPISVRPVGNAERFVRWCRRNPMWAGAVSTIIGLTLTLIVGLTYGVFAIAGERDEKEGQRKKAIDEEKKAKISQKNAEEKEELAKARLEQSLQAVGLFATDARIYCEDAMVPGSSRARLYGVLIKQLEAQAEQAGEATVDGLRNKAYLYVTLANVQLDFHNPDGSELSVKKGLASVDQWEKLRPNDETMLSFRAALLHTYGNVNLRGRIKKPIDADRQLDEALTLRVKLVGDPDTDLPAKVDRLAALSDTLESLNRYAESLRLRNKVVDHFKAEEDKHAPLSKERRAAMDRCFPYRDALCNAYYRAALHSEEYATRKEYLGQALALSRLLSTTRPTSRVVHQRWADIAKMAGELEFNFGLLAEKDGKFEEAKAHFDAAQAHYGTLQEQSKKLAISDELLTGLREYARSYYTLAMVEHRNGEKRTREIRNESRHQGKSKAGLRARASFSPSRN
jgi:serine/threonine protein kinase